jgi:long-chain acyl-CoA synthetase
MQTENNAGPGGVQPAPGLSQLQAMLTAPGAPFELEMVEQDGQRLPAYRHACRSLPELINLGRVHGERPFMVYRDERWSFQRFYDAADSLASRLRSDFGLRPGERVAIAMRNRPEWAVCFAAVAMLGAVPAPLNSFGMREELLAALEQVAPRLVFLDADRLERLGGAAARYAGAMVLAGSDADPAMAAAAGAIPLAGLCAGPAPAPALPALGPLDPALILFTSGATSSAKGVLSGQRAVCQGVYNIDYIGAFAAASSPQALQAVMARGLAPTVLTAVPLFHVSGLHAQLLASLRHGRRLVFMHRWDPAAALELMREEKVTQFNGAPSMVLQLLAEPGFDAPGVAGNLAGIGFGGAGLPQRAIDEVLRRVRPSLSGVGFGLTETNGVGTAISGDGFAAHPHTSGLASPIIALRLVDAHGEDAAAGESGEVWLRGVTLMRGYWGEAEQSALALRDGWFRSGDIGRLDAQGFLTIVDRIKDVINRAGEKIAAAEVESCLLQCEALAEAAVFAVPDELTGEAVTAVVVARQGHAPTEASVRAFLVGRLAAYKIPAQVHVRQAALPRTPSGKLLKQQLRREYLAG